MKGSKNMRYGIMGSILIGAGIAFGCVIGTAIGEYAVEKIPEAIDSWKAKKEEPKVDPLTE